MLVLKNLEPQIARGPIRRLSLLPFAFCLLLFAFGRPLFAPAPVTVNVWAIPYGGALAMTLVYRKDLFRKAGLDPDRPPRNWDEMYADAQKLTIPDEGQFGIGLAAGPSASWHFIDLLWSAGGEAVIQDKSGGWRAAYNDDAAVTALAYYQKLCRSKVAYRSPDVS